MDRYTKVVLTIIAVALVMISIRLWEPRSANAVFVDPGPTLGDLYRIEQMADEREREATMERLAEKIPLSYVWFLRDGTLDVYVRE
jgi:hypothetical protein